MKSDLERALGIYSSEDKKVYSLGYQPMKSIDRRDAIMQLAGGFGLATILASIGCNNDITGPSAECSQGVIGSLNLKPEIKILGVRPSAAGGEIPTTVSGSVNNVDTNSARVVLYAGTNTWYVQPWINAPFTKICGGRWSNDTHPYDEILALLVDYSFQPASTRSFPRLPDSGILAWDRYPY